MAEPAALIEHLHHLPALLAGMLRGMAQSQDPAGPYYDDPIDNPYLSPMGEPEPLPVGAIIVGFLIGIGINVLFGFWGKSRAEQHNVHPAIGFFMGFMFAWIGVALVPVFKRDRVFNPAGRMPMPHQAPHAPNPMYANPGQYQQPGGPPPGYPPPPQAYPQPPQYPTHGPMMAGQGAAPPPPPPPPQQQVLTADAQGYVACPSCGARTKGGRKTCMSCGSFLPPVYNPNIR